MTKFLRSGAFGLGCQFIYFSTGSSWRTPVHTGRPFGIGVSEIGMNKQAELANNLDLLWSLYEPTEEIEKNAAATYFFNLGKAERDEEAFGSKFCKLASALQKDPWVLAEEVRVLLPVYEKLASSEHDTKAHELARFYMDWADGIEKKAGMSLLGRGARLLARGAKAGYPKLRRAPVNKALRQKRIRAAQAYTGKPVKAPTPSWRDPNVLIGAGAVGAPVAGGMYLMGRGGQPQPRHYGG